MTGITGGPAEPVGFDVGGHGIKLLVLMVFLAGCATAAVQSPEVAPLQALADSIQPGYLIKTGRADRGYLGTMIGALVSGPARWLNAGNPCAGCPTDLRDEVVGTKCGEVIVVSRFALIEPSPAKRGGVSIFAFQNLVGTAGRTARERLPGSGGALTLACRPRPTDGLNIMC